MNDFQKIQEIKKVYDSIYDGCLNVYDTSNALLNNEYVTGGYSIGEFGAPNIIYIGDYIFLTENSTIYKKLNKV